MRAFVDAFAARYDRWLFREFRMETRSLAAYRVLYASLLLLIGLPLGGWIDGTPDLFFSPPVSPAALMTGFPDPRWVTGLNLLVAGALGCLLAGLCTRAASVATGAGLILLYSLEYSHGKVSHPILMATVPLFLAASGWGRAWSVDAWLAARRAVRAGGVGPATGRDLAAAGGWPVALYALAVSLGMFTAGWAKLAGGWLRWDSSATFAHAAQAWHVKGRQTALGEWLMTGASPVLLEAMDFAAVALELGFVLVFVNRRLFRAAVAVAALFHLGVALMFGIQFMANVIAYGAFVAWAAPLARRPVLAPGRAAAAVAAVAIAVTAAAAWGVLADMTHAAQLLGLIGLKKWLIVLAAAGGGAYLASLAWRAARALRPAPAAAVRPAAA